MIEHSERAFVNQGGGLVYLTVDGKEIVTTETHPFYVKDRGFVNAGELTVGDCLLDVNGNVLLADDFQVEYTDEPTTVYNFQVEDFHTYYVGEQCIWVHNAEYDNTGKPLETNTKGDGAGQTAGEGGKSSGLPDWLKERLEAGNEFNRQNRPRYPYNEVEVIGKEKNYVVDSYLPKEEIVSRKFTQLSEVKESTAIGYLNELKTKYPSGATISDSPFNPNVLRGKILQGDLILEIPVQNKPVPQSVLDYATENNIIIRDVEGVVYN